MRLVVTGSRGFIGSALVSWLAAAGHRVARAVRPPARLDGVEVGWDPVRGELTGAAVDGVEAVIHLAGEPIARGRWTAAKKARILQSRVEGTRRLCEWLAGRRTRPGVLLCASAVGFYGHRGRDLVREDSAPGAGFLADVCQAWEAATEPAVRAGLRVVHLRIGVVLAPSGGMLQKVLPPFRLGLGGPIGDGRQFLSWVALPDVLGAIQHALVVGGLRGPVNVVAPSPVTNRDFARTLGRVLRRPTGLPLPAPVARLLLGEMADELLLASTRVEPVRLVETGYQFRYPELEGALRHLLRREG